MYQVPHGRLCQYTVQTRRTALYQREAGGRSCPGPDGKGGCMSGSTARPRAPDWTDAEEAQLRAMIPDHRLVDIALTGGAVRILGRR